MGAPGDLDELVAARRALLDRRIGPHQRRRLHSRALVARARDLTTALLRIEATRPATTPAMPEIQEDPDDERGHKDRRRRWWDD